MPDLLVVGPGHLGELVGRSWLASYPSATVTLKFRSHNPERTERLVKDGFNVISSETGEQVRCKNVVFCAPPTGNSDYAGEVEKSIDNHWDKEGESCFIFTSAGSVYEENGGGLVDENSPVIRTERSGKMLDAEQHVVKNGGCVIRLGGLYALAKGAHNYWLGGGSSEFPSRPNGLINLIHYDDAAACVVACLKNSAKANNQVFLVSDGVPVSRKDICEAALKNPTYSDKEQVEFTGSEDVDGKKYCSDKVRKIVGWKPMYPSFAAFMTNPSMYKE